MMIDTKLSMNKSTFITNGLINKLRNGTFVKEDLKDFKMIDFKTGTEKKDFVIAQVSFYLKTKDNLFVINRSPVGFDGGKRISKGLSFLFSSSDATIQKDMVKAIKMKISKEMKFVNNENKLLSKIDFTYEYLGYGFNEIEGGPLYIFFVYSIEIRNTNIEDIFHISRKKGNNDLDYIFQIKYDFLNNVYGYFMDERLHFEIAYMKSMFSECECRKVQYQNAYFFPDISIIQFEDSINLNTEGFIDLLKNLLKNSLVQYGKTFIADIMDFIEKEHDIDSESVKDHLVEIFRCLYKVPLSIGSISEQAGNIMNLISYRK